VCCFLSCVSVRRSSPSPFINSSRCSRKTGHRAHRSSPPAPSRSVQRECVSLHVAPRGTQSRDVTEFRQYDPKSGRRSSVRVSMWRAHARVCASGSSRVQRSFILSNIFKKKLYTLYDRRRHRYIVVLAKVFATHNACACIIVMMRCTY